MEYSTASTPHPLPSASQPAIPCTNILGVGISAITLNQAVEQISAWIDQRTRRYVSVCTVHTIMECQRNSTVRQAINQASLATPDGMPLVWLSRWGGHDHVSRVYGPDLMLALCQHSLKHGDRHYFYGGAEGIPDLLSTKLQARFPDLQIAGRYSPPFRSLTPKENARIVQQINQAQPDIVWVGLGTPKQDLWMAAQRAELTAPVLIGVGAAFDFLAGRIPQAPYWMQRRGLEWLFRLWQEPRRLWYRYLVYNPLFVLLYLAQSLKIKRYSLE